MGLQDHREEGQTLNPHAGHLAAEVPAVTALGQPVGSWVVSGGDAILATCLVSVPAMVDGPW